MTEPTSEQLIEQARAQVRQARNKQAEFDELLSTLDEARTQLHSLRATATSPDGTVTVTAGAGGIVQSVELSDNALSNTNASSLASSINATIAQAIRQATEKHVDLVHRHVGQDVGIARILGPQAAFAPSSGSAPAEPRSDTHRGRRDDDTDPFHDPLKLD
ncbi:MULTISPECIES: YbaB/EbfC family nucleoid-associated protein [Prauserella salsuginis group]|uniref:YbaB/EbfC family nucleoid-associated protein n=1 Tax=Prauserella salsuginis TaxID=387889 RepID=A0ABW6FXS6_9PSEU|nr:MULTISPECIES: YbaB/EbfC family nucleoid-associated protein [Prauserella salsuginis group]MCR3720066.1 Conserved DNA-binding protein YbaB [Prauserella flava]MCR3736389.1 Conserved DNA-binding protein YbaB [Prauserella salsuginis]